MSCLEKALDEVDVLITSGGVSMGEKVRLSTALCSSDCLNNYNYCDDVCTTGPAEASVGGTFQCHHSFWKSPHEARVYYICTIHILGE